MKKIFFLLTFSVLTYFVNAQTITIALEDLAAKRVKSGTDWTVSDHSFDFKGKTRTGFRLIFTGNGSRGIVIKGLHGVDSLDQALVILRCSIKMSSSATVVKMGGNDWFTAVICEGCNVVPLKGGSASQVVYYEGEFNKGMRIEGFNVDHGRPATPGNTAGGACFQIAGSYTSNCNATNWNNLYAIYKNLTARHTNDEFIYNNYNTSLHSPKPAGTDWVLIDNCHGDSLGRDGFQNTSALKGLIIRNSTAKHGGLEQEPNHISGLSLNGDSPKVLVENVTIEGFPQFVYSRDEGAKGQAVVRNSRYDQAKAKPANSAMYLVGSPYFSYLVENNVIYAPNVLKGAISADKATVYYRENTITAPKPFVIYTGGSAVELPVIKTYEVPITVESTTLSGVTTYKYFLNGQELKP